MPFGYTSNTEYNELSKKHQTLKNENNNLNIKLNEKEAKIDFLNKNISKLDKDSFLMTQKYKSIELKLKDVISKNELMDLKKLKKMKIQRPSFQRVIVNLRVDELYESIYKNPNFIVPIYIGKIKKEYFIIDGQHRLKALDKLEKNKVKIENINVKIIELNNHKELKEYFLLINNSLALAEIYKEDDPTHIQILAETFDYFQNYYPKYFTSRESPNKPNFNVNEFGNILKNSYIIEEKKITKSQQLIDLIEKLNKTYERVYKNKTNYKGLSGLKTIQKRNKKCPGLYLRVNQNWLQDLKKENFNMKKSEITQKMRDFIWTINYGKKTDNVKCICCNRTEIRSDYFECGHIISEYDGGNTSHYNLKPICGKCNKSMHTMAMYEYMLKNNINRELALNMKSLCLSNTYLFKET